jgi:hypothetical protein
MTILDKVKYKNTGESRPLRDNMTVFVHETEKLEERFVGFGMQEKHRLSLGVEVYFWAGQGQFHDFVKQAEATALTLLYAEVLGKIDEALLAAQNQDYENTFRILIGIKRELAGRS